MNEEEQNTREKFYNKILNEFEKYKQNLWRT